MELDTRIASLCARARTTLAPLPNVRARPGIFEAPSWDVLSPERPLRYRRLIEIDQAAAQPLTASPLRADERIVDFVKGLSYLDERVAPFVSCSAMPCTTPICPPRSATSSSGCCSRSTTTSRTLLPLQLLGRDTDSKQLVARATAHRLGLTVYRMDARCCRRRPPISKRSRASGSLDDAASGRALHRRARGRAHAESHATPLKRFLARAAGVLFVETRETWPVPQGSPLVRRGEADAAEQRALWLTTLGAEHNDEAVRMAAQFNLSAAAIQRIARVRRRRSGDPLGDRLWALALGRNAHARRRAGAAHRAQGDLGRSRAAAGEKACCSRSPRRSRSARAVYDDWGFAGR